MATGERWAQVPRDLSTVTDIDRAAEGDPSRVGLRATRLEQVWQAAEALYRTGAQPAMTLVIRKRGQVVLKRALGCLSGNVTGEAGPMVPLSVDAPICLFSASKAITALLLHKQVELGRLKLDDCVANYIPAFAAEGKGGVTIRQLLAHRAGIPSLPVHHPDPSLLRYWDAVVHLLCMAPPLDRRFERQAYHALTGGFIIGELIRRVTGQELPQVLHETLTGPLGLSSMTFGLSPERRPTSPRNHFLGPKPLWPLGLYAKRVIGVPFERAADVANSEAFFDAVIPAGNIFASADDASRLFQMLLNGGTLDGVRVFQPETIAEAVRPYGKIQNDHMILLPLRFSAGFMLGENPVGLFGQNSGRAFGHLGFLSVLCWADPQRELSVAFLNTGKAITPAGVAQLLRLIGTISWACA